MFCVNKPGLELEPLGTIRIIQSLCLVFRSIIQTYTCAEFYMHASHTPDRKMCLCCFLVRSGSNFQPAAINQAQS